MKTLDFARAQIRFDKSSPITGPFRDEKISENNSCVTCLRMAISAHDNKLQLHERQRSHPVKWKTGK